MKIRLHIPALAHTITTDEYSHCAFTGKVKRFAPMMRSCGFEVYHYGVETSDPGADQNIQLLTKKEWEHLCIESLKIVYPKLDNNELTAKFNNPREYYANLANANYPIYKEFNKRLRQELIKNYRSTATDIVCLPFGPANEEATVGLNFVLVESGIGYTNAFEKYRIYESYAMLHTDLQRQSRKIENYFFVCPNYYNILEWPLNTTPKKATIGYFGRLEPVKGVKIVVEIALKFPDVQFILCGQGDPSPFLVVPNIIYKSPIHGSARGRYLGSLTALLAPSMFMEPFCGVSAEAQLCGTPVIGHDYGGLAENIEQYKTGVRCHTLSDFCYAIQMALDGKFDRGYIHTRAVKMFDMYHIAKLYSHAFKSILEIYNGNNGWYSSNVHIDNNYQAIQIREPNPFESLRLFSAGSANDQTNKDLWVKGASLLLPQLGYLLNYVGGDYSFDICDIDTFESDYTELGEILAKYKSDKSTVHNYHILYSFILNYLGRSSKLNILEIGMGTNNINIVSNMGVNGSPGASLYSFRDYLPNSQIYAGDIDRDILFDAQRIKTFYVDQLDSTTFDVFNKIKFDLVIDDGLHSIGANFNTLLFALNNLNNNGWIVIEDIHIVDNWRCIDFILKSNINYKTYTVKAKGGYLYVVHKLT